MLIIRTFVTTITVNLFVEAQKFTITNSVVKPTNPFSILQYQKLELGLILIDYIEI